MKIVLDFGWFFYLSSFVEILTLMYNTILDFLNMNDKGRNMILFL